MNRATGGVPPINGKSPHGGERSAKIVDLVAARGNMEKEAWRGRLQLNRFHEELPTLGNALVILANDPRLKDLFSYNEFSDSYLILSPPPPCEDGGNLLPGPYPRLCEQQDLSFILAYLQKIYNPQFKKDTIKDAVAAHSYSRRFHPVREWLQSLYWDGTERIDNWLVDTFDAENTPYVRAIGAKFLIAAVRRIMHPGTKFDTLLIIEGDEGLGKSTAIEKLFSSAWFTDDLPHNLNTRDAPLSMIGKWGIEMGEIAQIIGGRNSEESVRAWISRKTDRYRPMWGSFFVDRPRQCVMTGTTNKKDYLRDTFGNRRYLPFWANKAKPEWIEDNREQLWAEAVWRESAGEDIYLENEELRVDAMIIQAKRMEERAWDQEIADWVKEQEDKGNTSIRTSDVLSYALNVPREQKKPGDSKRVGESLMMLGYERKVIWDKDTEKAIRSWVKRPRRECKGSKIQEGFKFDK